VFSGYRFVLRAAKVGRPIVIINEGETRGDGHAAILVNEPIGTVLPDLADRLKQERAPVL